MRASVASKKAAVNATGIRMPTGRTAHSPAKSTPPSVQASAGGARTSPDYPSETIRPMLTARTAISALIGSQTVPARSSTLAEQGQKGR